jgi:inorganic triphosphatase YgiF
MPLAEIIRNITAEFNRVLPRVVATSEEAKGRDLTQMITLMSAAERARLADFTFLKQYVDSLPEVKAMVTERDRLLSSNLDLAAQNITKIEASNEAQQDEDFSELSSLRDVVATLTTRVQETKEKFKPQVMVKVLKAKLKENQESCMGLAASLANSEITVDRFCKSYRQLRMKNRAISALMQSLA